MMMRKVRGFGNSRDSNNDKRFREYEIDGSPYALCSRPQIIKALRLESLGKLPKDRFADLFGSVNRKG